MRRVQANGGLQALDYAAAGLAREDGRAAGQAVRHGSAALAATAVVAMGRAPVRLGRGFVHALASGWLVEGGALGCG
jgi:hypothetical protein